MGKQTKTAFSIVLMLGLITCSVSTARASPRKENSVEENILDRVDKQFSVLEGSSISIDVSSDADIGLSPDDRVHVTYYDTDQRTYEIEQSNDELKLNQVNHLVKDTNLQNIDVTVLIPAQFDGLLNVNNSRGSITAENISVKGDISITSSSFGSINLSDVTSTDGVLIVNTSSYGSDIIAKNISVKGNISATTFGSIELTGVTTDGALIITSNSGDIDINTISAKSIDLSASFGQINAEQIVCTDISMKNRSNDINFSELNAQNIIIGLSSGSVRGSIIGSESDFTVTSRVFSGMNNLPEDWGSGSKTLGVSAGSGHIDIRFTESTTSAFPQKENTVQNAVQNSVSVEENILDRVDRQFSILEGSSISTEVSFSDVSIGLSPDDKVHITYYNTDQRTYQIEQSNDELKLNQVNNWAKTNVNLKNIDVTVLIPAQFNGLLNVNNSSGSIDVENISVKGDISISENFGDGSINLTDVTSTDGTLIVNNSGGRITTENISVKGDISITSYGSMNLNDVTSINGVLIAESFSSRITTENISIKGDVSITSYGSINLSDVESTDGALIAESLSFESNIITKNISANNIYLSAGGDIQAERIFSVKGYISISSYDSINLSDVESTDGVLIVESLSFESDIIAKNISANNIHLSAYGDISGSIVGSESDFSVTSRTSGSNNLPSQWGSGSKTFDVFTDSGNIDISFTE